MKKPVDDLFPDMAEARDNGICPFCKEVVNMEDLRDEGSRNEFNISGLCQQCQDEIFGC